MKSNFVSCLPSILKYEFGYTNNQYNPNNPINKSIMLMKFGIIFAIAFLLPIYAYAQQAQPTIEQMQTQMLIETGQLRLSLGQAMAQIAELRKQLAAQTVKNDNPDELKK
jgi:hypothetical protein